MKKCIFFFVLLISFSQLMKAQVKIGGDMSVKANPSSVLELESTDKGFLISRLTTGQITSISQPATGLLVFNVDLKALQMNIGTPESPQWANLVVVLPAGTTGPATPPVGTLRITAGGKFEGFNGSAWVPLGN